MSTTSTLSSTADTEGPLKRPVSVSDRIRKRLQGSGVRFFANDNISAFIEADEMDDLVAEVGAKMQAVLRSLVIDVDNDHNSVDTGRRVAKMFIQEVFRGRYEPMPPVTEFPNVSRLNELMIVGPITVRSACSHHLCPVIGKIWIGVLPRKESNLIGLSKYVRLVHWIMCRPQIQEEAIIQLADMLDEKINPDGLAVLMEADHFCMQWRGVQDMQTEMLNSVMRGAFATDETLRREFLSLIKR